MRNTLKCKHTYIDVEMCGAYSYTKLIHEIGIAEMQLAKTVLLR